MGTISALEKTFGMNILSNEKSQFYSFISSNINLLPCLYWFITEGILFKEIGLVLENKIKHLCFLLPDLFGLDNTLIFLHNLRVCPFVREIMLSV